VASELAGSQITTLMEALPGIATVLRSPVADAMIGMIRAAARLKDFSMAEADELIKYATRRGLLGNDEGERVLAEALAAEQKRAERLAERHQRESDKKAAAAVPKPAAPKPAPAPKAAAPRSAAAPKPVAKPKPAAKHVAKPKAVVKSKPAAKAPAKKPAAKAKKR
jgi:outer membrane biosynthesis protein TonB